MKRPGRPPLARNDTSVNVHFRLPGKTYDLTQKHADQAGLSLSEYLRSVINRVARGVESRKPWR